MSQYILILYNWIIWNVCFSMASKNATSTLVSGNNLYYDKDSRYYRLYLLFAAFSLFTFFGGDAAKYKENVELIPQLDVSYFQNQMEYLYIYLALLVKGNFYLWKIIVYGASLLITFLTLKKLKVDSFTTLMVFVGFNLFSYGASRAILGFALYVYGLAFISEKKIKSLLIGLVLIVSSYFAHTSIALIILITPLCWLNLTKKRVMTLLALFPIVLIVFNYLVTNLLGGELDIFGDYMAYKLEKYTDEDGGAGTNYGAFSLMIQSYFKLVVIVLFLYWSLKAWFQSTLPDFCGVFIKISFYIAYISLLFRFSVVYNAEFLYNRYISVFPFIIYVVAAPLYESRRDKINSLLNYKSLLFWYGNYVFAYLCYIAYANNKIIEL